MSDFDFLPDIETEEDLIELDNDEETPTGGIPEPIESQFESIENGDGPVVDGLYPIFIKLVQESEAISDFEKEAKFNVKLVIEIIWWDVNEWKRVSEPDWHKEDWTTIQQYEKELYDEGCELTDNVRLVIRKVLAKVGELNKPEFWTDKFVVNKDW